jgi:hypothetical protein
MSFLQMNKLYKILIGLLFISFFSCSEKKSNEKIWMSYVKLNNLDSDFKDMKEHGVDLVDLFFKVLSPKDSILQTAKKYDLKLGISLGEHLLPSSELVEEFGLTPEEALMIGGVYNGKAIERYLFSFSPSKHEITIEPPVYNPGLPYKNKKTGKYIGHYFPDTYPVKAEIIVPTALFDGQQHLKIIPANITPIKDTSLEFDTFSDLDQNHPEKINRTLYKVDFDLSSLDNSLLENIGIAVYWKMEGSDDWFIFNASPVSMSASSTHNALKLKVRKTINEWSEANNGVFPADLIKVMRIGDECFHLTGHASPENNMVSLPLWDFSNSSLELFRKETNLIAPRTWGYPEIYGEEAYARWMYNHHKAAASVIKTVKNELKKIAPTIKIYRNTTRAEVFSILNDHDGSGSEVLTKELDIVHIDPYPAMVNKYTNQIPVDMSYYAGLARRYNKPIIPWMQAHIYGETMTAHLTPETIDKMLNEQYRHGISGIVWLGYGGEPGFSFPEKSPESWEYSKIIHKNIEDSLNRNVEVKIAALRFYDKWALTSFRDGKIINPDDWIFTQALITWSIDLEKNYDVFEIPPDISSEELDKLNEELKNYEIVITNKNFKNYYCPANDFEIKEVQAADKSMIYSKLKKISEQVTRN